MTDQAGFDEGLVAIIFKTFRYTPNTDIITEGFESVVVAMEVAACILDRDRCCESVVWEHGSRSFERGEECCNSLQDLEVGRYVTCSGPTKRIWSSC